MAKTPNENGSRLDRIEKALEHLIRLATKHEDQIAVHDRAFERVHQEQDDLRAGLRDVLAAQVIFVDQTRTAFAAITESLSEVADKLNGLIDVVEKWPKQPPPPNRP